jgi:hypothetical protein
VYHNLHSFAASCGADCAVKVGAIDRRDACFERLQGLCCRVTAVIARAARPSSRRLICSSVLSSECVYHNLHSFAVSCGADCAVKVGAIDRCAACFERL